MYASPHFPTSIRRSASVIALGAALALAGCGPKTPAAPTVGAAAPLTAQDPSRVGQAVPMAQGGYATNNGAPVNTAPGYAQVPVQTAQVQPQYAQAPQPQYVQQPQQPQYAPAQSQQPQYAPAQPQYAPPPQERYSPPPQRAVASATYGAIEHIEEIRTRPQGSGAGAVIGGVLGAVVGNQFGHGGGKAGMTALGAAGGAVAGNNIERNRNEGVSGYRVTVRMDNGQVHVYEESSLDGLRIGDRVHQSGGRLRRA